MPGPKLRYATPVVVELNPTKGSEIRVHRIAIQPGNDVADYEFSVFDENGKQVSTIKTSDNLPPGILNTLIRRALKTMEDRFGEGIVE